MWIKGFIHQTEDEAFLGNVHIVSDLRFSSSWKIISVGYRSAAEKMLGFKVGDKAYRVNGTWTLDEQYEYWLFDMSTAVETSCRGRGRWERSTG